MPLPSTTWVLKGGTTPHVGSRTNVCAATHCGRATHAATTRSASVSLRARAFMGDAPFGVESPSVDRSLRRRLIRHRRRAFPEIGRSRPPRQRKSVHAFTDG